MQRYSGIIGAVGILVLWAAVTYSGLIDSLILPTPTHVAKSMFHLLGNQKTMLDIWSTLEKTLLSIGAAALAGIPLGLFLGYNSNFYGYIEGPVHALRSIPATALFPLFLIIFGIGTVTAVVLAAYPAMLIIIVNTVAGVRLANKTRLHLARQLQLGPFRLAKDVLFYEALPSILNGLRTAISYALVLIIAIEMFLGAANGIGRQIYVFQSTYKIPETYAAILLAAFLGIGMNWLLSLSEHRILRWMPNYNSEK